MIETARGLRLLLEAPQPVGVLGDCGRQNLDCHGAIQARVVGAVDFSHAACANGRDDLVRAEFVACCQAHYLPPTGTRRFKSSKQLRTMLILAGRLSL